MGMPILSNNSTLSFKKKPLDKENSVHIHKITLFIHNKELHYGICRKVDHYVGEIRLDDKYFMFSQKAKKID